jgi:hypothetical protein
MKRQHLFGSKDPWKYEQAVGKLVRRVVSTVNAGHADRAPELIEKLNELISPHATVYLLTSKSGGSPRYVTYLHNATPLPAPVEFMSSYIEESDHSIRKCHFSGAHHPHDSSTEAVARAGDLDALIDMCQR